jgi:uncharacterized protein (TIGR02117 family)
VSAWRLLLRLLPLLAASLALSGCVAAPVAPDRAPKDERLYLIAGGWHTEIALSRERAEGLPPALLAEFPGARYLVFGWGARGYYTARDPGLGDALRALLPGPAVTLVIPLRAPPAAIYGAENVMTLAVSRPGMARLRDYLAASIAIAPDGTPRRAGTGPDPGSLFFQSTERYDAANTCNTWTAKALHAAALPIDATGVVFAGEVLGQAKPLAIEGR